VHGGETATPSTEDDLADEVVARGRNAGGVWIIASVLAFGSGLAATSADTIAVAWSIGLTLFTIGMVVRARYWRSARRRLGDAAIRRARWRTVDTDGPGRLTVAVVLVLLVLGIELWT
jgi:uncharacterized membrane protein YtjA (UPF0391 family)